MLIIIIALSILLGISLFRGSSLHTKLVMTQLELKGWKNCRMPDKIGFRVGIVSNPLWNENRYYVALVGYGYNYPLEDIRNKEWAIENFIENYNKLITTGKDYIGKIMRVYFGGSNKAPSVFLTYLEALEYAKFLYVTADLSEEHSNTYHLPNIEDNPNE